MQAGIGSALLRIGPRRACDSRAIDVVSDEMALAMPKSISFRRPSTTRKFAGLRSLCTMRASWIACTACARRGAAPGAQHPCQAPDSAFALVEHTASDPDPHL